ncbi:MAG: ABC transporter ATP-binding protein [Thermoplasmata archaeon]|nr:MAG: ABC transporter ATP-binding protein [Thermoplasmata archaeon]
MSFAIETNGLTKVFGDLIAVDHIDIKIKEGTINGFIGPNGAGKSTTMKMLIGALRPTDGSGTIKGYPLGSMESKQFLGYSPEHPKFYEDMTAHKYLVYMGMICGLSKQRATARTSELLKWLNIEDFAEKKIRGFSAGMRQKLSLAQSMIHEPEILILDEPTANLDPAGRFSIIENLKELSRENKITVFISSHILAELEKLVDEVTLINHGKIVVESDVTSLKKKISGNRFILKTSDNKKILSDLEARGYIKYGEIDENDVIHVVAEGDESQFKKNITEVILKNDVWLEKFNLETSDLESVFMQLVGEGEEKQEAVIQDNHKSFWRFWK